MIASVIPASYCSFQMSKMNPLQQLLSAFQEIGKKIPTWTQAQGSNLSFKDRTAKKMYIKPSGYRLDAVKSEQDLVVLDLNFLSREIQPLMQKQVSGDADLVYSKVINDSKVDATSKLRPSMETGFHLALQNDFVFHFHALSAVVMGHFYEKDAEKVKKFLSETTQKSLTLIDYGTPGLDLTLLLQKYPQTEILLLKSHGVILNSNSPDILNEWAKIEKAFCQKFLGSTKLLDFKIEGLDPAGLTPIPLKILFPDFAVFFARIKKCLILKSNSGEDQWVFDPALVNQEKDLFEIWLSYWLLYTSCSDLEPLKDEEAQKICGLPTEQYRLMIK